MTDTPKLKPCPCCGGAPYLANVDMAGCSYVVCTDCRLQTDDGSQDRAVKSWNTRAALSAMQPPDVTQWEPIETAPDMERIWICGWQPKIGRVMGYWWYHEDVCDGGVAIEHPNARYWSPIVIPMFPPTNWANLPPAPEAK